MRYLVSTICIALLLCGCGNTTAAPEKPKVVRKKIVAPKDNTAGVTTQRTVRTAKTEPVANQQTKTAIPKVEPSQAAANKQPAGNNDTDPRQLIAQRDAASSAQNQPPGQPKPKKPAISPKSEITEIKQPVQNQVQAGGGQTAGNQKPAAEKPVTASTAQPDGVPPMYDPTGKIDPFEPLVKTVPAIARQKKQIKRVPRTPLERIDLSQLKLVGIILAASGNRALVEEASGKGYVIKKGTYIGTNGGKIVEIEKEVVTIEEKFEDVFGKIQTRKRELKLPKPPGEF